MNAAFARQIALRASEADDTGTYNPMSADGHGTTNPRNGEAPNSVALDALLTPAQFAAWIGESEYWVRRRLASLPGVIREGRKHVRIHPRTYLEKRLRLDRHDRYGSR